MHGKLVTRNISKGAKDAVLLRVKDLVRLFVGLQLAPIRFTQQKARVASTMKHHQKSD